MEKEFEKSLGPWFEITMKLIDHAIEDMLFEHNINLSKLQFVVLKRVKQNEGIKQNDLAFIANKNKSTLTRLINSLEKKNYIARIPSKEDKRVNKLFLTTQGRKVIEEAKPLFMKFAKNLEKGLSDTEIKQTIELLKKIQVNVSGQEFGPMIK